MSWYDEGYFKLYGDLRRKDPDRWIAKQYLIDTLFDFDLYRDSPVKIGRETYNNCPDYPLFNTLTLDQARKTQIDIVICTVHENESYFARLKELYPNAKFIRQVGNDLDTLINEDLYPNLLASAQAPYNIFNKHKVLYRQEFDLKLFQPSYPKELNNLWSFQNDIEQFEDTWTLWTDLKHKMRDYTFKSYGVGCEQGKIYPKRQYVNVMQDATFLFQSKGPWEGYGHVIHNAMCLGKPMIIRFSDYGGKMAESLLIKDQTYIDMDDPDLVSKIRYYSDPERYIQMANKCMQVFNETVDFDREFVTIKKFFDELI